MGVGFQTWQRVHINFAGPFMHQMFLLLVDAHSKWGEVIDMLKSTMATSTVAALRQFFCSIWIIRASSVRWGPQFTSVKSLWSFYKPMGWSIANVHHTIPHPMGLLNNLFALSKKLWRQGNMTDFQLNINSRTSPCPTTTPHATTGLPPCDLFLGWRIWTKLDLLKPDLSRNVNHKQAVLKAHHYPYAKARVLDVGERVMVHNFGEGPKWLPVTIPQQCGPVMFEVKLEDGRPWKRHTDQLKLQEQNHSSEPECRLPSDDEVDNDPGILLSPEEHSPTLIVASQPPLTSITPLDDS